ncbi:murein hydrolase activator EnvC family protein [Aliiroseovarius sp.]|uniref:murein hydrolase activator EnvC family protein n=1 Tax=Aliiroseovarius sp. TaxID=1872442 RepID=UPI003BA8C933
MRALLLAGVLWATQAVAPAAAQSDPAENARAAMEALDTAALKLREAEKSRDRVAALTETVQAYETGLAAMREGLRRATIREASIRGVFEAESGRLAQLLAVLQRIEAAPEPSLLLHPDGPTGTARSGMILSDVAPALQKEAMALKSALQEVAVLRALQESAVGVLEEGLTGAQEARTRLSQAISDRTDLPRRFTANPEAMQTLITSSETLEAFASGLMTVELDGVEEVISAPDFTAARGDLDMPVLGTVLRRFDQADAAGIRRPGWVIATRPKAIVTTPWPATIRYLGPLLDYGNVMVLEPGEGYLLVLAGLDQLYGQLGEVLPKGGAVGLMGGAELDSQAILMSSAQASGAERSETLYMELRWNSEPVDPKGWFAAGKD